MATKNHQAAPYPEARPLPTHFRVETKLGFPPVLLCPCGARIQMSSVPRSRPSRALQAFVEEHSDCSAPGDLPKQEGS